MVRRHWLVTACASLALASGLAGCVGAPPVESAIPSAATAPQTEDERIAELVSRMSLERKVAQLIQPQINSFTAEDMARYRFGSYLNGGNGGASPTRCTMPRSYRSLAASR
jgi:beta-glucosidase